MSRSFLAIWINAAASGTALLQARPLCPTDDDVMQELYAPPKSERKGAICCNRLSRERRPVDEEFPVLGLFRGWMLTPESYGELNKVLWEKGVQLINSPEAYLHCHHLPEWYAKIERMTSRSVWIRGGVDIGSAALRALIVMMREP